MEWKNPFKKIEQKPKIRKEISETIEAESPFWDLWQKLQDYKGEDWKTIGFELETMADMVVDENIRLRIKEEIAKLPPEFNALSQDKQSLDGLDGQFLNRQKDQEKAPLEVVKSVVEILKGE